MIEKSREEIAWLAGLLEGEGCFQLSKSKTSFAIIISVCMTDLDIIERARTILGGTGQIYFDKLREGCKQSYTYRVYPSELSVEWMKLLFPLMGIRRRTKIAEIIDIWENRVTKNDRMRRYNYETNLTKKFASMHGISFDEAKEQLDAVRKNRVN